MRSELGALIVEYFRRRWLIYGTLSLLFVIGVVAGSVAVDSMEARQSQELSLFVKEYVTAMQTPDPDDGSLSVTTGMLMRLLQQVGLPFLLGLTIVGSPLIFGVLFVHGFAMGFSFIYLLRELSWEGVPFALAAIVPHQLFLTAGTWLAAGAALSFAVGAGKILLGRREEGGVLVQFLSAAILAGVGAAMVLVGVWTQAHITPVLVRVTTGLLTSS